MNSTRTRRTILSPPRVCCWIRLGPTTSALRTVFPVEPQESGILYCSIVHFKKDLLNHYLYLTKSFYDVDTPQTFKSVCVISATIVGHWTACSIKCVLDFLFFFFGPRSGNCSVSDPGLLVKIIFKWINKYNWVPAIYYWGNQGCAIAETGGLWGPTFALRWLENLSLFMQIICWQPRFYRFRPLGSLYFPLQHSLG